MGLDLLVTDARLYHKGQADAWPLACHGCGKED